jgi:hypothetical protein
MMICFIRKGNDPYQVYKPGKVIGKYLHAISLCKPVVLISAFLLYSTFVSTALWSQQITNYSFAASTGTFTALSTPINPTLTSGNVDDGYFNDIPVGFNFWYMGTPYTTVSASTNGWLTLGADITNSTLTNNLSTGGTPRPVIAPLWDDISVQAASNVSYKVTGSAPNRVFTIQYLNTKWRYNATGNTISFQTKLYESTGKIEFIYRRETGALATPSASIGITAAATESGNFLSVNNAGTAVSSTVEASVTAKPATGRTFAFTPLVPTTPGSLTFSDVTSSSMTLNWSDLSSNEIGFFIYRSTDNVNYSLVGQTASGATSLVQSGLTASATYYWKIYAAAEGGMSAALSGSQSTESDEVGWYNSGWLYRKAITIDYTKVAAGPHANFPMLISRVDTDLQNKAQADADDILFTAANGTTKLSHEIESYTDASGALVAWVNIPSLSSVANTVIYMYYGNSVATNQQFVAGTWESNFKGVYHLNNSFNDATSNAYDGTNTGTSNVAGQIANGRGYTAGNKITIAGEMDNPVNVTLSAWVNLSSLSSAGSEVVSLGDHMALRLADMTSGLDIVSFSYNGSGWNNTVGVYGVSGWHYIATTFDDAGNSQRNYLDGVLVSPTSGGSYAASINYGGLGANTIIGDHGNGGSNFSFRGTLDEVRVTGTARSAGWLWTEYNNQNAPSTFYNAGSEEYSNLAKIFTGTGNFSEAARWTGGTLPVAGENIVIDGTCTIDNFAGTDNVAYGSLIIGTGTGRTLNWAAGGTNRLNVLNASAGLGGSILDMTNGGSLIIRGSWTATNLTFTPGAGTVELQSTLTLPADYANYNNLMVNGSGITVSLATAIVLTGNLTITNGTLNANNYNITAGKNWTNNASLTAFTAGTGTLIFNSTTAQSIGGTFATTFNNLTTANIADTVLLQVNASLSGNLSVASGTFNLAGYTANRTSAGGTLNLAANTTLRIGGTSTFPANYTTNTLEATSTVEYAGTTQIVKGLTYGNLTLSGAGNNSKTADGNINVNGVFNLSSANASATQGCLEMSTYTLDMGANAITIGPGDVTGIVRRTSFLANIEYTFGNQFTTATFAAGGTYPSELQLKITIGTAPAWKPDAIQRIYDLIQTGATDCYAIITTHYLDSELNGNDENLLVRWRYLIPLAVLQERGRTNINTTDNWVTTESAPIGQVPTSFNLLSVSLANSLETSYIWNGSQSTSWTNQENWTPQASPSIASNIIIPDASTTLHSPTLPNSTEIKTLSFESGGILNAVPGCQLVINGNNTAWSNVAGTFNASTSKVIFTNAEASISGTSNFYDVTIGNTAGLTPGADNVMRIAGTLALEGSGILRAVLLHNTIEYNGANQTVINPNGLTSGYHNLILSGSGTKTLPGTALSIAEDFSMEGSETTIAGAALSVGGNVTISSGSTLNLGAFNHTIGGNLTNNGGTLTSLNSSLVFSGSGPQTITSTGFAVNDLTITNTSAHVILGTSTDCNIGGNLTVDSASVFDLTLNRLVTVTGSVTNSGTIKTQNTSLAPLPAGKIWDGYVEFTGADAQTMVAGTYNNLTMSGSGGATAETDITVNGILNLSSANPSTTKGSLDMGSFTVLMGPASTTIGLGDITGIVRRTTLLPDITYSFGNRYSTIRFPNIGTLPSEMSLKISIGTVPTWRPGAVKRIYDFIQTGGSDTRAVVYCHYLDSELNGNIENLLVVFVNIPGIPLTSEYGRSAYNASEGWIGFADSDVAFFSSSFGDIEVALDESEAIALTWTGAFDDTWPTVENWSPNAAPSDITIITIPDAATTDNDPTLPTQAICGKINIESGGIVNAVNGAQLTITGANGAWSNTGGTFNAGTSTVVFKNSGATMTGSSDFNNITIDYGATLELQNNVYLGITGTLANNGTLGTIESGNTTVEYKGGDQEVVAPTNNSYSTLILSGTGTKTMPVTALTIEGDFFLSDTASATAAASIVVGGDVTIDSSAVFITGPFNHSIGGNFSNNGTFTASSGNTITMNGTTQSIQGSNTTIFDNLTIDNTHLNLFNNIHVNGALTLSNGHLYLGETTLALNGTISKTSGYIEVVPQSSLVFGGTGLITLENNLFNTTPSIQDLTINRAGGVVLGNQDMTVNGLLDLSAGTLSLAANTLTLSGQSPNRASGLIDASNIDATLVFANDAAIILPASIFTGEVNNLTITGAGGITASSDFTIKGILHLQSANPSDTIGSLDMRDGSTMKILTMGADATTVGTGDVTGIIKRTTFIANTVYTFGNQFTTINFAPGGTYPSQIQAKVSIGSAPSWKTTAINRLYDVIQTGADNCLATVAYHYLDSELNGNIEGRLIQLVYGDPGPPVGLYEAGRSNSSNVDNWVSISNILFFYFATSYGTLQSTLGESASTSSYTWNGSQSTVWANALNWTPAGVPTAISYVVIPDSATTLYDPTLPAIVEIKTLDIETAGLLNAVADAQYTINGDINAWNNNGGTFNALTSNVIFTNTAATFSGETNFYNITIFTGAGLFLTAGSDLRIAGNLTNDGTLNTTDNAPTIVEYNGTSPQTMGFTSPTTFYNLIIDNVAGVTLTSDALINVLSDLTINSGTSFELASATQLSATGSITNIAGESGLLLHSDATGTATLLHNSDDVTATVECYMGGAAEAWHFISSPVSNQEISGSWLPSGTYGNGTGYDLYLWNEANNCWIYNLDNTSPVNWSTAHPGADFESIRGYLYAVQVSNPTKVFAGKLNNGPMSFGLTFNSPDAGLKGFNLVGNPYPSAIDWASSSGWSRNSLLITGGGYDMWIWNPAVNNYGVYNSADADGTGTNSVSRYIASMQGYFVQAGNDGDLGMDNDVRFYNGTTNLLKSSTQEVSKISVGVKSDAGYGSDEIQLKFGYDENENGAMKLFSKVPSAPSLFMASEGNYLSVLYFTSFKENPIVPMQFSPGSTGNFTFNCNFDLSKFETVMLEDRQTQKIRDLKVENTYSFYASKTDNSNRFVLHFEPIDNLPVEEFSARMYINDGRLIIDLTLITKETEVWVYDIMGRLLLQQKLQGETTHEIPVHSISQILVVQLKNPDGSFVQKINWQHE